MSSTHTRDHRRRFPSYPLPERGLRIENLLIRMGSKDIRHACYQESITHLGRGLYGPHNNGDPAAAQIATLQALTDALPRTVSHQTAAIIHGVSKNLLKPPFHLTVPRDRTRVKHSLVIGHRSTIPTRHIWTWWGVPVTSPAWTWTDLALSTSLLEALILADTFIRPGRPEFGEQPTPLASKEQLRDALKLRGSANGVRRAAKALHLARIGIDSPQETALRFFMHEAGLPEPEVNVWLLDQHGHRVVQPDMVLRKWRLTIQYDGEDYHSGEQMRKDVRRAERTEDLGWKELRITKDHMGDHGIAAISKIERELRSRGWRP